MTMKIILSILTIVSLVAVEAQNVSCNFNPTKALTADFIPTKTFRVFGQQANRENWCVSSCGDNTNTQVTAAFQYEKPHSLATERALVNTQESEQYFYCANSAISDTVAYAVNTYKTIDEMTSYLQKQLNYPGWAYLLIQNSRNTATYSSIFPSDNNFCFMTVSKGPVGYPPEKYSFFAGLVRA